MLFAIHFQLDYMEHIFKSSPLHSLNSQNISFRGLKTSKKLSKGSGEKSFIVEAIRKILKRSFPRNYSFQERKTSCRVENLGQY